MTATSYTLTCALSGDEPLVDAEPKYEYNWLKDEQLVDELEHKPMYEFDSLTFNDAGNYQCQVFVTFNRRLNRVTINGTSPLFPLIYQRMLRD